MKLSPEDIVILGRIQKDFFYDNPVVCEIDLEGQSIDEEGRYVLGCRAGPHVGVENLMHEMGHLADREIPKLLLRPADGWGYYIGKTWHIMGRSGIEPTNDRAVTREASCWAFQSSLMEHYGTDLDIRDLVSSATYLPAFDLYVWRVINEDERQGLGYTKYREKAIDILAEDVAKMHKTTHTFRKFVEAWDERMVALKSHPKILAK